MLAVSSQSSTGRPQGGSSANQQISEADARIDDLRQQLTARARSDPQTRAELQRQAPELMAALDDPARFRDVFWAQQSAIRQSRDGADSELSALDDNMDEDSQTKIYEAIRQKRVMEEASKAMEEHPEREMTPAAFEPPMKSCSLTHRCSVW